MRKSRKKTKTKSKKSKTKNSKKNKRSRKESKNNNTKNNTLHELEKGRQLLIKNPLLPTIVAMTLVNMWILKRLIDMNFKAFLPHLTSLLVFIIASLLYFHPVLKGQKISQSDITQYI